MTMSPDNSRVLVGGSFSTLNGVAAYGMGALDAATGATLPWAASERSGRPASTGRSRP